MLAQPPSSECVPSRIKVPTCIYATNQRYQPNHATAHPDVLCKSTVGLLSLSCHPTKSINQIMRLLVPSCATVQLCYVQLHGHHQANRNMHAQHQQPTGSDACHPCKNRMHTSDAQQGVPSAVHHHGSATQMHPTTNWHTCACNCALNHAHACTLLRLYQNCTRKCCVPRPCISYTTPSAAAWCATAWARASSPRLGLGAPIDSTRLPPTAPRPAPPPRRWRRAGPRTQRGGRSAARRAGGPWGWRPTASS